DDHILFCEFHHGHGIVYGEIGGVALSRREICAQHIGVRKVFILDFNAVLRKKTLFVRRYKLQRTPQQRKNFYFVQARRLRGRVAVKRHEQENCWNYSLESHHGAPSFSLSSDHSVTGIGSRIGFPRFGQLSAYKPVSVEVQIMLRSHSIKTLSTVRS